MNIIDYSFQTPEENLLYDDFLLHRATKNNEGEFLRFWESPKTFVVLGRICQLKDDVYSQTVKEDRVPVFRRSSGGGTVVQGQGCLNYSFVLSQSRPGIGDLRRSYKVISEFVIESLKPLGVNASFFPISDIALENSSKKFSGNAQKRPRNFILHHGTILYNFDIDLIIRYLKMPQSIPDYREERNHRDFVTNIDIDPDSFKKSLAHFVGGEVVRQSEISDLKLEEFQNFVEQNKEKLNP